MYNSSLNLFLDEEKENKRKKVQKEDKKQKKMTDFIIID